MPEDKNAVKSSPTDAGHVPITEEFDSAKWTLPSLKPLLIALVLVTIVFAVIVLTNKAKPTAAGTITKVVAVQQEDAVIVAIQLKLENLLEKSLQVEEIHAEVETAEGRVLTDQAAPGVDNERYFKAVPELRAAEAGPFRSEQKIAGKGSYTGVIIVTFPIDKATFEQRKSLKLNVDMLERPAMTVKQ